MSFIQHLAPELKLMILEEIDSPQDLYNLIRASPDLFQVFLTRRSYILYESHLYPKVVRAFITPGALKDASAIIRLERVLDPIHSDDLREVLVEHLRDYFTESALVPDPDDEAETKALYDLHRNIDLFITDYASRTLSTNATRGQLPSWAHCSHLAGQDVPALEVPTLSYTELSRLRRAFYRMYLYTMIVRRRFEKADYESGEEFHEYFSRLEDHEVEEVMCVFHYVRSQWDTIMNAIPDQLLSDILAAVGPQTIDYDAVEILELGTELSSDRKMPDEKPLLSHGQLFNSSHRSDYLRRLSSFGLPCLQNILQSDARTARSLFQKTYGVIEKGSRYEFKTSSQYEFDAYGLYESFERISRVKLPQECQPVFGGDKVDGPNQAWCEGEAKLLEILDHDPNGDSLRQAGWVFWDKDRLQKIGVPCSKPQSHPKTRESGLQRWRDHAALHLLEIPADAWNKINERFLAQNPTKMDSTDCLYQYTKKDFRRLFTALSDVSSITAPDAKEYIVEIRD